MGILGEGLEDGGGGGVWVRVRVFGAPPTMHCEEKRGCTGLLVFFVCVFFFKQETAYEF